MRYDITYFVECEDTLYDHLLSNLSKYIYIQHIELNIVKLQLPASMFNVYVKILPPAQFSDSTLSNYKDKHTHTHTDTPHRLQVCVHIDISSEPSINK